MIIILFPLQFHGSASSSDSPQIEVSTTQLPDASSTATSSSTYSDKEINEILKENKMVRLLICDFSKQSLLTSFKILTL